MALADHALVVGISRYPGIGNLAGPETDAREFFAWVTDKSGGGVDPAHAKLIVSSGFAASADAKHERPAQEQIHEFFTDVDILAEANNKQRLGMSAGRRLWMFFSGHGFAPSIETSGLLMANATTRQVYSIGAARWADRLCAGGWFEEVLLFQDSCRSRIAAADLDGLFLLLSERSPVHEPKRFYAFSAKDQKLSKELPFPDGKVRGVFTATLLDGLRGAARDPVNGAITARSLKTYLQDNMSTRLPDADKANPEIAKEPDVRDFDAFDIVPAAAANTYAVDIMLPAAALDVTLQDGAFRTIATATPPAATWTVDLPPGIYRVIAAGMDVLFKVAGPGLEAGGLIHVRA